MLLTSGVVEIFGVTEAAGLITGGKILSIEAPVGVGLAEEMLDIAACSRDCGFN